MTVNLSPDGCSIYRFWQNYLSVDQESAVLPLDGREPVRYFNATAGNRYRYGIKNGYTAREISWSERNEYLQDIHLVNTSLPVRQGVEMKENYLQFPSPYTDTAQCQEHYNSFIACFKSGHVIGYISTNFCGDLVAASQILGHGDHLKNGVMLVLWAEFVRISTERGIKVIVYSRWKDGKNGLKYWKHSVGMSPIILKETIQA